jgi:acyl-CoA synthetase (AMP-forming)/AMP-acid ligase II
MAVSGHGDRVAVGSRADGLSFSDLGRCAAAGAAAICASEPAHVIYIGRNGPAYPQVLFAAAAAGVPFVPLNYRLGRDQLHQLIAQLARPFVIADYDYLDALPVGLDTVRTTEQFLESASTSPAALTASESNSPAVLLFTSGTTARPKAVALRHEHLSSYIISTVEFGGAAPDEAALVTVPPYHVAAVGSVLSNLYAGRRVTYLPDFEPAAWLNLVRAEGVTSAMVVPTMLSRVVDQLDGYPADVPTLRTISYGGARMPRPVIEQAVTLFPDAGFVNAYGLTETSSTIALLGPDEHRSALASDDPAVRDRLSSIGRPVPGVEVQIRGEDGLEITSGAVGELWVCGPQVSGEYRGQASALDADGWFCTRDLARRDDDGYLFIEGRADDTIIRGGENIAPAEIEDVLIAHPGVKDVAVIGLPDDEWGERICAVVVPSRASTPSAEELRSWVRHRLRGSRTPDDVVWRPELPMTPTGKVIRRELVAELCRSIKRQERET